MSLPLVVFVDYLLGNLWWIVGLSVVALIGLIWLFDFLYHRHSKKTEQKAIDQGLYLAALGGLENVLEKKLEGSRIVVKLKDYSLVNRDKLHDAGVTGFIQMSDQLTLVIKKNAAEVYAKIFKEPSSPKGDAH
jgi:phosphotransferase system IIB component